MADATTSAVGEKRKRPTALGFYAVKVGRVPGIYQTWDEANQQIQGFSDAHYKKFNTMTEAEAMMNGNDSASASAKSGKQKFYAVARGHTPGVYTEYATVQAQTKGFAGGKQKAFATRAEAQAFVAEFNRGSTPTSLRGDLSDVSSNVVGKDHKTSEGTPKKQKKEHAASVPVLTNGDAHYAPGYGPLPPDARDGFDRTLKLDVETGNIRLKTEEESSATKLQPTGEFNGPVVVYTDGSTLNNGKGNAIGGVGVWFGPQDNRNVSEPLRGSRQTNQRAELTAVARAFDHVAIDRDILIVTDSYYSIRCLTEWFEKWERNNWKNASGKDVENKDLIEPIVARIRERELCRAKSKFKWIKGHSTDAGNIAADNLAVQGSRSSTPDLRNAPEFSVTLNTVTRSHQFMSATTNGTTPTPEGTGELDFEKDTDSYDALFAELADGSSNAVTEKTMSLDGRWNTEALEQPVEHGTTETQENIGLGIADGVTLNGIS